MSNEVIRLTGIAWDHTRAMLPMLATAQRFKELHGVEISWTTRSLQSFADQSMSDLAAAHDLVVMDHPWAGAIAGEGMTQPLNGLVSDAFLADQATNSVGGSYDSYVHDGQVVALGIDAAAPVAASRPDLLAKLGRDTPKTWNELIDLARLGVVGFAAIPLNTLMAFYMVVSTLDEGPFDGPTWVVGRNTGTRAIEMIRELASYCSHDIYDMDPIRVWETMSSTDRFAYAPFDYGYSNYSRLGYATHQLQFHDLVEFDNHGKFRSTLGGAGLAISDRCNHPEIAAQYVEFVGDPITQSTLYFDAGGQPAHRNAWTDPRVNDQCLDFFSNTLPTLDRAYVRSTFPGYLEFQDSAAPLVHACILGESTIDSTLDTLERLAEKTGGK